ncbi:hypothetical protein BKI52_32885 [marine bacterium AO1-C]|nr:hypothetical protein BKI52_32885 [marine bacterium AO1-C]
MIRLITSTLITLILSVNTTVAQNASAQPKESFDFYYNKASKSLNSDLDSAYTYSNKAFTLANGSQLWKAYFLRGLISKKRKEYGKSIILYNQSVEVAEDTINKLYVYNNIANTHVEAKEYQKALPYARKVKIYRKKSKHPYLYNSLGILAKIHSKTGHLDSAKIYFDKAISLIPKKHDKDKQVTAGFLQAKAEMFAEHNYLDSAITFYKQAIHLQQSPYKKTEYLLSLSECYLQQNKISEAQKHLVEAQNLGDSNLHNQAKYLQLTASIQFTKRQRAQLDITYAKFNQLISENSQKLSKSDMQQYFKIQTNIYQQSIALSQQAEAESERVSDMRLDVILALLVVLLCILVIYLAYLRAKRLLPELNMKDLEISAHSLKHRLKVAYVGKPDKDSEKDGILKRIRQQRESGKPLFPS